MQTANCTILQGDALGELRKLATGSVQCCVTSPPYWGLRDYGVAGQLGLEATPEAYLDALVAVKLGRRALGIELNPKYIALAEARIRDAAGLLLEAV